MCSTQMRTAGMTGIPYGLDYTAVDLVASWCDFDMRDPDLFDRLRAIESEYVRITAEDAERNSKRGRSDGQSSISDSGGG